MAKKIKKSKKHQENNRKIKTPQREHIEYPVFSFLYLHKKHGINKNEKDTNSALLYRLKQLSELPWIKIQYTDKHGFGSEKIDQSAIKPDIPSHVTPDTPLLALRYSGNLPFVGYRDPIHKFIFHIIYVEKKYGDVYEHGRK